jgi:hypothetical protein
MVISTEDTMMTERLQRGTIRNWLLALILLTGCCLTGCGGGGDGGGGNNLNQLQPATATFTAPPPTSTAPPPTATSTSVPATATSTSAPPTATPTTPATAGLVAGLVVLRNDVPAGAEDALGAPPPEWAQSPDAVEFDTALSHADWLLEGMEGRSGTTAADGRFEIRDLPPGRYTLIITKSLNGNLANVSVPIVVGSDGSAEIVIEIDRGFVRATSTYLQDGALLREVNGPTDARTLTREGQLAEFGNAGRTFTDIDGDGMFDPIDCEPKVTSCDDTRECTHGQCRCSASCPFCDDCGPPVCTSSMTSTPYRCNDGGGCALPGDVCVCVPSCDDCLDCTLQLCVPGCEPFEIDSLVLVGPSVLRIGRQAQMRAVARLSNGGEIDVTYMVSWRSVDASIASVDSWGTVVGHSLGTTEISAAFGDIESAPVAVTVVERPGLRRIQVEIGPCFYPIGLPEPGDPTLPPSPMADYFPDPSCRQIVRVGRTLSLLAFGEFEDGAFEDITRDVDWRVDPAGVGTIDGGGQFTAVAEGTASITAALGGVTSEPREIRVVAEATIVQLSIHAVNGPYPPVFFPVFEDDPRADAPFPCFECGFPISLLRGDVVKFIATARYDTGEWEDVSERVTWRSSNSAAATIDTVGMLTAVEAGSSTVDATLDEVTSNPVNVTVVNEATLLSIYVYPDGADRVVGKGGQAYFRATGNYDVGFGRDVTAEAAWHSSDESVGGFDEPGVFTGRSAGEVQVWAELAGKQSERLPMKVFETSDITYCDAENVNRGIWSDAFNRVVLESDCAQYTPPSIVNLRFTVTERERPGGIFDPCLDLFVFQDGRKVRTIRNQGCGEPFLAPGAPEFDDAAPRFQLAAFWDLKDERGNLVPPGRYTIHGRFYLYFDPVVSIDVTVTAPNGRIPCIDNACGNGCGYVHACGDGGPPTEECPAVCVPLCECPQGWGITDDGDCEPCPLECCPPGVACLPGVPPCAPEACGGIAGTPCPPGQACDMRDPTCSIADGAGICVAQPQACPENYQPVCGCDGVTYGNECMRLQAGATLAYAGACVTRCCPAGADCAANIPPCEPRCCPPNAGCTPDIPPCEPGDCCPAGAPCIPGLPPCDLPCCPLGALCGPLNLPPCESECCPDDATLPCPDIMVPCDL